MRHLITGGCGFLGSNLAAEILKRGEELFVFDSLFREGSYQNLQWLKGLGSFKFYQSDVRSINDVEYAIKDCGPDVIFHLAGQVAMTTSLANPRLDFEINVVGGHNILESVRKYCPNTIVTYSSTNKVYGDLEWVDCEELEDRYVAIGFENGFDETIPLKFESPYGCSKGAVDQYMLDYHKMFDLNTVVFRHSSIFGGRQFSTFDQGWVGWFVQKALEIKNGKTKKTFTVSGNGKQVRDVLTASDLVKCYFSALSNIENAKGQAFNIGGGIANSLSLRELFRFLEQELDVTLDYECLPWRKSDQKIFVADVTKAKNLLGWGVEVGKVEGIHRMIEWQKESVKSQISSA